MRPYSDSRDYLLDELHRIDLVLQCYTEATRESASTDEVVGEFESLYVSDERVDGLLQGATNDGTTPVVSSSVEPKLELLTREIRRRRQATTDRETTLRLIDLRDRFDLSPREIDILLLSLAPAIDDKYATVYGYLHDDLTQTRPTVGLILDVLCRDETERLEVRSLFARQSTLVANQLLRVSPGDGDTSLPRRTVSVDERIVEYLLDRDPLDARLSGIADVIEPTTDFDDLPVSTEARRTLESLALADDTGEAILCYLSGPAGVGKSVAVEALCCRAGIEIITADLAAVHAEELGPVFDLLIREAALRDAAVCLTTVTQDDASDVDIDAIARSLDRYMGPVFLTGSEPWTPKVDFESHRTRAVHLPPPDYTLRRDLWRAQSERLPASVEPDMLAATFRLTAGEIDDALSTADALAADEGLTEELVYQGCRAQSSTQLSALATTVDPHYGWKDIVLPDSAMIHLREVAAHVAHRGTVYTEWGFDDRFSLGNGLTVLFSGPSGTGKTMAAEIIAGEAGLALYKVDLSSIVSKYIGETEKNLSRIFEEAADSDAILLFDEADALFGKRTDVKDSHDRYANIEVNYLLQRVEEHDGTVILTTNLEGNVDDAFRRRIHLHVEFPLPDDAARGRIWEAIFPQATPTGDLDIEFLSGLALTGGNIKNIALTAAFLAAADGDSVEMQHIIKATEREFQKTGKRIDPQEFEMYREFLYE